MFTVVMRNTTVSEDGSITYQHEAIDHVPDEQVDAYVADARTRWTSVEATHEGA